MKLLSTKILSEQQKKHLKKFDLKVTDYDAIKIELTPFEAPREIENAIFTSQHAVEAILDKKTRIKRCFCVGEKTNDLLVKNGLKVVFLAKNASELANFITKSHKSGSFYFFSGSRSLNIIPSELKKAKISYFDIKTYKTDLNMIKFNGFYDEILFFSPSGVQSFTHFNDLNKSMAICIGETTANEAKKHTKNIMVAEETTIESVLECAVKTTIND